MFAMLCSIKSQRYVVDLSGRFCLDSLSITSTVVAISAVCFEQ